MAKPPHAARVRTAPHRHAFTVARIPPPLRQRGFAYMALLVFFGVFIAVAGAAMMSGGMLQRRNAEEQLIFVGGEFRRAIESYYLASASMPPGTPRYPEKLDDLLADPRSKELRRHLRQIYPDPLMGHTSWGTVPAPGGGIMGVYSLSPAKAVKLFNFPTEFKYLEGKKTIAEWKFLYIAPALPDIEGAAKALGAAPPSATAAAPVTPSSATAAPAAPAAPAPAAPQPATPPASPPTAPQPATPPSQPANPQAPGGPTQAELEAALKKLEQLLNQ
jgi:type II secretory pathway pseudopilin PulG